ncbi:fungal-specific transcription factor domain-containing protein [Aspergillus aurantiobrunneus]
MEYPDFQRQTRSRASATCRTCKGCRQRKHPKCSACRMKNQHCEYPRDREGQKRGLKVAPNTNSRAEGPNRQKAVHGTRPISTNHGSPQQLPGQNVEKRTSVTQTSLEGHEIQVFGATSLLHGHLEPPSADPSSEKDREDSRSKSIVRHRLIAFSAITRQKETMFYSTPSIAVHADFDGVPSDTAMHLLELHWNRLLLMYMLTYRPAIMDSLFTNGPYVNKLLLNAIYLQSSLYSDRASLRPDPESSQATGMAFYHRFKALLVYFVVKPSMPTIVALLTCGACLVQYGEQSASWVFCGMVYRMIIDLGYHLDDAKPSNNGEELGFLPVEEEIRRRVYWGAYATHKAQSIYLGRSPGLPQSDSNELETWTPYNDPHFQIYDRVPEYQGRPSYALSTFQALLQLSVTTEMVIDAFYSTRSAKRTEHTVLESRRSAKAQLHRWRESISPHLVFDPSINDTPPPHQITLYTTYWTLHILTNQPAVLVLLQHADQDCNGYLDAIRFFWHALLEYQSGCGTGLKQPLRLLKSLMIRVEKVARTADTDHSGTSSGWPDSGGIRAGIEAVPGTTGFNQADMESWDASWLSAGTDDLFLTDDTVFGLFTQG